MAKKEKLTSEQQEAASLANRLKDLQESYIPEPTVIFKVGDRVQYGHIDKSIIKEIVDGGKIYLLAEEGEHNHYGKMIPFTWQIYVSWLNLTTYRTNEENAKIIKFTEDEDIQLNYSQRDVAGLFNIAYHAGLDFSPPYQRDFCWTLADKVKLIDSIFKHIDIGKFAFIQRDYGFNGPLYEILDGKQRMRALMDFYENQFAYKGIYYKDLCNRDEHTFTDCPVSVGIAGDYKMTEEFKLKYFLKLNVSGVPQSEEHLAKVQKMLNEIVHTKKDA